MKRSAPSAPRQLSLFDAAPPTEGRARETRPEASVKSPACTVAPSRPQSQPSKATHAARAPHDTGSSRPPARPPAHRPAPGRARTAQPPSTSAPPSASIRTDLADLTARLKSRAAGAPTAWREASRRTAAALTSPSPTGYGRSKMSIERRRRRDGRTVYVVRWYESGRDSTRRKRTFDRRRDAELFEASIRRARQLGQLASEVIGSNATLEEFLVEWWDTYAAHPPAPEHARDLHDVARQVDRPLPRPQASARDQPRDDRPLLPLVCASTAPERRRSTGRSASSKASSTARSSGAGLAGTRLSASAVSRTVAPRRSMPGPQRRSRQFAASSTRRTPPSSASSPTRASVPAEAYALVWGDVLDDRGKPRKRLRVQRAISGQQVSTTEVAAGPVSRSSSCRSHASSSSSTLPGAATTRRSLCSRTATGGHLRRHNWRRRVWIPALERAGVPYFRSYDLRHTCATLLLYEGRTLNEVAEHLGHADPGFTARTYAHVMRDAPRRRRITISEAIRKGRVAASRRPRVDPSDAKRTDRAARSEKKSLQIERADARTRTGDPFITSEVLYQLSYVGSRPTVALRATREALI